MLKRLFLSFVLLVAVIGAFTTAAADSIRVSITKMSPSMSFSISKGVTHRLSAGELAAAVFSDPAGHPSNFGQLNVMTNSSASDDVQMFAAGFVEGVATAERIFQYYNNMKCQVDCSGAVPPEIEKFFLDQDAWTRKQIAANPRDAYWQFLGALTQQFDGIQAGYAASDFGSKNPLSTWAFMMINAMGDLFDISPAVLPSRRPDFAKMTYHEAHSYLLKAGHCSALIKVTDDLSDILVGHNAWFTYSAMIRIFKTYDTPLANTGVRSKITSFSSYPGTLSSLDDFYMMAGSNLIMTQTTNNVFNASLWDLIVPETLLAWQRVRAANHLANSGPEWYNVVAQHNSGTYNNQYMVLDAKLFKPKNGLQANTLFVVEQIPGMVQGKDVTDELVRGYWPSYNVPYHKEIYVASGYPSVDQKQSVLPFTQYHQAPRAKIFRRDQSSVQDLSSLQFLMRTNNFQTDPYSGGSAWGAISARGDLDASAIAMGGYDSKVTSISAFLPSADGSTHLGASIVNGPTSQGQKPFSWTQSGLSDGHMGQPDTFDFVFEAVSSVLSN